MSRYLLEQTKRQSVFERYPKTTTTIIILFLVLVMDILAAQILSAVGLYHPQYKIERYYRIQHDAYHHTLAKNIAHSDARWGPIGYRVDTNSLGFKDRSDRKVALETNEQRIVFLGDSFTEGVGYEYDQTFVGLIDRSMQARNIGVLNAAVSSYSPIIYLRKTEYLINDVGLKFDHLIVFIDISDIEDEAIHYEFDEQGSIVDAATSKSNEFDEQVKRFITEETILLSNLRIFFRKLKKSNKNYNNKKIEDGLNVFRGMWTYDDAAYQQYGKKGIQLALEHMGKLSSLLKQHNIKLSVAVYPWPDQIMYGDVNSRQVTLWKSWASDHDVEFINLFPAFMTDEKAEDIIRRYYILGDVHWNKAGHELVAKNTLKYLANY